MRTGVIEVLDEHVQPTQYKYKCKYKYDTVECSAWRSEQSLRTSGPVNDLLRVGITSRAVTSQLRQLSLGVA